jgi:tRNA C32,U32 (ribose-2'-O)-methylase TrmJ
MIAFPTSSAVVAGAGELKRPSHEKVQVFFEKVFGLLDHTKFWNPENPEHLRDDLWALFHRMNCDERELRILFGVITAFESLRSNHTQK